MTRTAIDQRGAALASGLVTSVSVPAGHALDDAIVEGTSPIAEHRLLNPAIAPAGESSERGAL